MNIVDIVIVLLLILSILNGARRGFLKETVNFAGTIIVYVIAYLLKNKIGVLFSLWFPFFDFKGVNSLNILLYQLIAFIVIAGVLFGVFNIVLRLSGIIERLVDSNVITRIPSKILGGVVGFIDGYIILFAILLILSFPLKDNSLYTSSVLKEKMLSSSPGLTSTMGKLADLLVNVHEIQVSDLNNKNELNTKVLKMYLDADIISTEDLGKIIDTHKLDNIDGIENFK